MDLNFLLQQLQQQGQPGQDQQGPPPQGPPSVQGAPGAPAAPQIPSIDALQQMQAQAPPPQTQAPAAPGFDQQILQQSVQTPEQAIQDRLRELLGGRDKPSKKQRFLEVLKALTSNNYVAPKDEAREQGLKDYALQTQRLGIAAPMERIAAQRDKAEQQVQEFKDKLAETIRNNDIRGNNAANRNNNTFILGNDRNANGAQANILKLLGIQQQAPLTQAKTGLANTQNTNAQATGGLSGVPGLAVSMTKQPDLSDGIGAALKTIRDNSKFPPSAGGSNNPLILKDTGDVYDQDTGTMGKQTVISLVNRKNGEVTPGGTIKRPYTFVSPKESERVVDFGQASDLSRDLAQTYARALASGDTKGYLGLLQGSNVMRTARAKGFVSDPKSVSEAFSQILGGNALYSHVASFAGRRLTNRELDFTKQYLGHQSDTPEAAIKAAAAAALITESMKLRNAHVLPNDTETGDVMEAAVQKFWDDAKAGKSPKLPSLTSLLIQTGRLNGSGGTGGAGKPNDELNDLRRQVQERLKNKK